MADDEYSSLYGQALTRRPVIDLSSQLAMGGLSAQVRESSHYTGGIYIRVYDGEDFTFERISGDEYLIRGFEPAIDKLLEVAMLVSSRMTTLQIRHSMEIYTLEDTLAHYLHYEWPA